MKIMSTTMTRQRRNGCRDRSLVNKSLCFLQKLKGKCKLLKLTLSINHRLAALCALIHRSSLSTYRSLLVHRQTTSCKISHNSRRKLWLCITTGRRRTIIYHLALRKLYLSNSQLIQRLKKLLCTAKIKMESNLDRKNTAGRQWRGRSKIEIYDLIANYII